MGLGCSARFWLAFLAVQGAVAAEVERVALSQAYAQLPAVKAYVDIVDATGQPPASLTPADLTALLGAHSAPVTSVKPFPDTGEGVAYVFLIDVSKSIGRAQFAAMRAAIQTWIAGMKPADRAAIATLGDAYRLVVDFSTDKQKLGSALDSLEPRDMQTRLYLAISQAVELNERIDPTLPVRRAIVVLSDGKDEGSALTPEDVLHKLRASRLPIYSIGLSHLRPSEKHLYLDVLRRFSTVSGGIYQEATTQNVAELYAAIQQAILRVFVLQLTCASCPADGRSYPLEITFTQGPRVLRSAAFDVFAVPDPRPARPNPAVPWWRTIPIWMWLVGGIALLVIAGFALFSRKQPAGDGAAFAKMAEKPLELLHHRPHSEKLADSPPAKFMPLKFTVVSGKDAGSSRELQLQEKAIIGRAKDCDLVLEDDPDVSNRHCELALVQGQLVISDLASTNQTYVNGVPVQGLHKLEPLDLIRVGDTELRIEFEES